MPEMEQIFASTDIDWKNRIKKRDGKVCRRCGFDKNLEGHHILPQGKYPALADLLPNGITLCGNCHVLLKGKELRTNIRGFLPDDPNIENQLKELKNVFDTHYGDAKDPFSFLVPHLIDTSPVFNGKSEPMNKSAQRYFRSGKNRYRRGAYESAIKRFDQALLSQTDFPDVYLWRGKAKGQLKLHKSAIYDCTQAITLRPDDADAYISRGYAKYKLKQYESACTDFDMALRLKPDDANIYYCRGYVKKELGLLMDAIDDFDETLRLNPDDAHVYRSRGLARTEVEKFDDAINDFNKAIDLTRDQLNILYHKAAEEKKTKDVAFYLQLLHIDRGNAKMKSDSIDEAQQDFKEALRLAPQTNDPQQWHKYLQKKLKSN